MTLQKRLPIPVQVFHVWWYALNEEKLSSDADLDRVRTAFPNITPDFHALRGGRRGAEAMLVAFDLIEHNGKDLRDLRLIDRKRRLSALIGKTKTPAIQYGNHLTGDGPSIFAHVYRMGLEGIVSKRTDAPIAADRPRHGSSPEESGERGCATAARGRVALVRELHDDPRKGQ